MTSTFFKLSVPYASAAIACAPPALYTSSAPHSFAATSVSGAIFPYFAGVVTTIRFTPAAFAGRIPMHTEEESGAVPPGT